MFDYEPKPYEYGGEGYEKIEYGHRFDCGSEPGHEDHVHYEDSRMVIPWNDRYRDGYDPHDIKRINNHPVVVIKRTVTYGPWEDDDS